jgi:hypothetical protein
MPKNQTLPTWLCLNACDDKTATGMADVRTGDAIYGGALNLGDYFDITEAEAKQLSYLTTGTLHAGRYRRVQVDSGATQAYVKTGTIGYMVSGLQPNLNVVTSYDKGIVGVHTVIFLNAITAGNFGFVQEVCGGIGNCLCGTTITSAGTAGDPVNAVATGVIDRPSSTIWVPAQVGLCLDPPMPKTIIRVSLTGSPMGG